MTHSDFVVIIDIGIERHASHMSLEILVRVRVTDSKSKSSIILFNFPFSHFPTSLPSSRSFKNNYTSINSKSMWKWKRFIKSTHLILATAECLTQLSYSRIIISVCESWVEYANKRIALYIYSVLFGMALCVDSLNFKNI